METERLVLDLELGGYHPSGWLEGEHMPSTHFEGYVQLIGAIERLRTASQAEGSDEPDSE